MSPKMKYREPVPPHEGAAGMSAQTMHSRTDAAEKLDTYEDVEATRKGQVERFQDELKDYVAEGVLTELRPAFSRDTKEKVYVQHLHLPAEKLSLCNENIE